MFGKEMDESTIFLKLQRDIFFYHCRKKSFSRHALNRFLPFFLLLSQKIFL